MSSKGFCLKIILPAIEALAIFGFATMVAVAAPPTEIVMMAIKGQITAITSNSSEAGLESDLIVRGFADNLDSDDLDEIELGLKGLVNIGTLGIKELGEKLMKASSSQKIRMLRAAERLSGEMRKASHLITPLVGHPQLETRPLRTLSAIFSNQGHLFEKSAVYSVKSQEYLAAMSDQELPAHRYKWDLRPERTIAALADLVTSEDWRLVEAALVAIRVFRQESLFVMDQMLEVLADQSQDPRVRIKAVETIVMASLPSQKVPLEVLEDVVKALRKARSDGDPEVKASAIQGWKIGGNWPGTRMNSIREAVKILRVNIAKKGKLVSPDLEEQTIAVTWHMGRAGKWAEGILPDLIPLLKSDLPMIRTAAGIAIGKIGVSTSSVRKALDKALKTATGIYKEDLEWALYRIK